jgi:hypothetical protein
MRRRTFLGATLAVVSFAISAASLGLREAAAQVISALKPWQRGMRLPPVPKWNKSTDDLDYGDFARRVREYQWSLFPPDTIVPREGQIWEAVRDCKVGVRACIAQSGPRFSLMRPPNGAVVPGCYRPKPDSALMKVLMKLLFLPAARLQKGERVRVLATDPKPTSVSVEPLRYDELHDSIVPRELRAFEYRGYQLVVETARPKWCPDAQTPCLNEDFRFVEDAACGT